MATNFKGVIERISEKPGKFGLQTGLKVGEAWYDVDRKGAMQEGDFIEFQATQNDRGYWKVVKGSIKAAEAPTAVSKPVGQRPVAVGTSGFANDGRQNSIVYQSSRKDALVLVDILLKNSLIDLGKSKNLADKQAIIETYADKYTEHFVEEVNKGKAFAMQQETTGTTTGKPKPLEEEDAGDDLDRAFS